MIGDHYILDDNGNAVATRDIHEWGRMFRSRDRQLAETEIGYVRVSTVFVGIDQQWEDGPPLLWETMIFGGEHDDATWRYATRAEAEAGHKAAVELVTSSSSPSAS